MARETKLQLTNRELVEFLSNTTSDATFVQKLKIKYRPYICPFNELVNYALHTDSVFDVGCGSGQFALLVANYTDVKKVKGIEIDKGLVRNAKKISKPFTKTKKMEFAVFNGNKIPDDIKHYDLVYMIDVYHHIPRNVRENFMKQLYAKMKKGSKLMFKDIDAGSPFVPFNKMHDLIFAKELGHEISNLRAVELLSSLGYEILESRKERVFVYPHYFVLAQK